jgi:hypothetical protein
MAKLEAMNMERKMFWGHVLFAGATVSLAVKLSDYFIGWPSPSRGLASLLTGLGICILIGSSVYATRPWHKHVGGGIGLAMAVTATLIESSVA